MGRGGEAVTSSGDSLSGRNYVVHGAGAIGSVIAARLHEAGARVGLVARGAHLEQLQRNGLRVTGSTEGTYPLPAAGSAHELDVDEDTVVILAMKTSDTEPAVSAHADLYRELPLVCCQNGVTNEEVLSSAGYRTYGCTVMIGAAISEPGVVWHTSGVLLVVGCWPTGLDAVCHDTVGDMTRGRLDARLHENVFANKWGKLVSNLGNAYLALLDLPVQEASCRPEDRWFIADVEEEAACVLEAAGIEPETVGKRSLREGIARLRTEGVWEPRTGRDPDARSYPSTWQDLTAGRRTVEVDHFNGVIVRLGEQYGIPTPLNRVLRDRCEDAAARGLGPGSETNESLRAAAAG